MKSNVIYLPAPPPPPPAPPSAWSWRAIVARCSTLASRVRRPARPQFRTPSVPALVAPRKPRRPARVIDFNAARARLRPPVLPTEVTAVAAE